MSRRWRIAGMVLVSPFLVCTLLTVALAIITFLSITTSNQHWVENQTAGPITVWPVWGDLRRVSVLPHRPTRLPSFSPDTVEPLVVPPGESRRVFVDTYLASDRGGAEYLIIRTADGSHFPLGPRSLDRVVVGEPFNAGRAAPEVIAVVEEPIEPDSDNSRLRLGVVVVIGLAAPVALSLLARGRTRTGRPVSGL